MFKLWKSAPERNLEDLERRVRNLEADFKALELDWTNVWQKVRRALGRFDKVQALERAESTENSADDALIRENILRTARGKH